MTLSSRLNLLIGALLCVALVALAALLFVRGMSRIKEEEQSMLRAAEFVVHAAVPRVRESGNPDREIAAMLAQLRGLKHISIRPVYRDFAKNVDTKTDQQGIFHDIAKAMVGDGSDRTHTRIEFQNLRAAVSAVELSPNPADEIEEIVGEVSDILLIAALFSCFVFVVTRKLVSHALKPIAGLQQAISDMQDGNYNASVTRDQSPEFSSISRSLEDLSDALRRAQQKSRRLAAQLVSAQDRERKDIARELHDELGAYLFSIRAQAASLQSQISAGANSATSNPCKIDSLIEQLDALRVAHRHVLQRLAPPGLQELGLKKALQGLVEQWRTQHAGRQISATINVPDHLTETLTLTIYRIVQEGVTNALKHSNASQISISVDRDETRDANPSEFLSIKIVDDGGGMDRDIVPGFGLKSMEERVLAIGGTLNISNDPSCGTCLEAMVELRDTTSH